MNLPNEKQREVLVACLYSAQWLAQLQQETLTPFLMHHFKISKKTALLLLEEAEKRWEKLALTQERLESIQSGCWRDCLRIERAIFCVVLHDTLSTKRMVGEAMRLAKKYGCAHRIGFVRALIEKGLECGCLP